MKAIYSTIQVKLLGVTECLVCLLVFGLVPTLVLADARLCPYSQAAELGGPGRILCNFPKDVYEVYWFDNISDSSPYKILYNPNEGVKSGPGFDRGEYDVQEDGSLIIKNVTRWHERMYKVLIFKQSSLQPDTLIVSLRVTDARLCPDNQTVELGGPGRILCNLPEDFYEVYWFDNISDSSPYKILYNPNEGVKSGPGFDRGEYDVQEDGSLIIKNVTRWHERMYKVLIFKQSSLQPDTLIVSLRVTDARLCPDSQTAELGGPGRILCNLPEDFYEVYWFDNISDSSPYKILYNPNEGVKSGPGFDRGEYDVQEDGSLIIKNVTRWHERMYKVLIFKQSSLQPDTLIVSLRVTDARLCPDNQTAELGGPGRILCNFPKDVYEVYWFDNISDSSPYKILYNPNEGVKSGPGFDRGEYDVQEDGSLIIKNVTRWHERMYKVLIFKQSSLQPDTLIVSLRVTASPNHDSPNIGCQNCYDGYYHRLVEGETLSCSFGAARPPVQLEWFYQSGDGYDRVEMQSFSITENENGTYNSLATFQSLNSLTHSLVCRATWPTADWRREKEVLVDFSTNKSFSDIEPETQYMELNKYTLIPCGGLSSSYMIWKKIIPNDNPELVGFHSHIMTRTITSALDIEVSIDDGSLTFLSVGVHNEGMYVCVSGDGLNEEIHLTSVKILILPSPPYINITGCDDVVQGCRLSENTTKVLQCAVRGVRPAATLEWIAEDTSQISFFNRSMVSKENNDTFDTILSVEYEVSKDVLCGEEIFVQCNPHEPLSELIEAEATAFIIPVSCKEKEAAASGFLASGSLIFFFWIYHSPISIIVLVSLILKSRKGNKKTAKSRVAFIADIVVQVIIKFFHQVRFLALFVWFWLSRKAAYGLTTWEMVLFITWTVISTLVLLVFRVVLFVWRSCKGFEETAKSRVVSVTDIVFPVLDKVDDVFFVAILIVWFWSFWTAGLTLWEIVLYIFLTVFALIHMFCKLWMFRLSCKRNKETANSRAVYLFGIVNTVIVIIYKEVWYLIFPVWFLSFLEASDSGLTPWEIVLFIFLAVYSVLRIFRPVCRLWQSWKGNEKTANRVEFLTGVVFRVKNILREVLYLAVIVWFWSLWKESEETALKGVIIVALIFQPVVIVLAVYYYYTIYRDMARRRRIQLNAELALQRIMSELEEPMPQLEELMSQLQELEPQLQELMPQLQERMRISMGSMRRTESAGSLSLLNVEGNGQPTEHAERFTLQNAEALTKQRRLRRHSKESKRLKEIMQQIESAAESSSSPNVEGNGQPTEHAERFTLQDAEGNGELEPTENAERIALLDVEGNGELEPAENAERIPLQNSEGNRQSVELC